MREHNEYRDHVRRTFDGGMVIGAILIGALILLCAVLLGCTSPAQKVLRSVNDYEYYNARYSDICVITVPGPIQPVNTPIPPPPAGWNCLKVKNGLILWSEALDEAGAALKRGGAFPLQLKRLQEIEKATVK